MNNKHTVKKFIPGIVLSIMLIVTAMTILLTKCEKRQQRRRFQGLYTDGQMLFVLEENRLCQYDINEKKGDVLLSWDTRTPYPDKGFIRTLCVDGEYIVYSDGSNLKTLERSTGTTETVMEFEKYIRPATKTSLKGKELMKTKAYTEVSEIVRKGGEIYFNFATGYKLRPREYPFRDYGDERWETLYRYDMNNKTLYPIQIYYRSPEEREGAWFFDIHVIDEHIYFRNDTGVLRMNGDGSGTEKVYEFGGELLREITWKEDGFDCFVYKEQRGGYYEFVSVDKDGNVLFCGNFHEMFREEIESGSLDVSELVFRSAHDNKSGRYVFMNGDEVKSAVLNENAGISTIAAIEMPNKHNWRDVMPVNGHIFVLTRNATVYGEGYSIFDISPSGEVSTFITVGN